MFGRGRKKVLEERRLQDIVTIDRLRGELELLQRDGCRKFAQRLPAGRAFDEFGGDISGRLYTLKDERDGLLEQVRSSALSLAAEAVVEAAREAAETRSRSDGNRIFPALVQALKTYDEARECSDGNDES